MRFLKINCKLDELVFFTDENKNQSEGFVQMFTLINEVCIMYATWAPACDCERDIHCKKK